MLLLKTIQNQVTKFLHVMEITTGIKSELKYWFSFLYESKLKWLY